MVEKAIHGYVSAVEVDFSSHRFLFCRSLYRVYATPAFPRRTLDPRSEHHVLVGGGLGAFIVFQPNFAR